MPYTAYSDLLSKIYRRFNIYDININPYMAYFDFLIILNDYENFQHLSLVQSSGYLLYKGQIVSLLVTHLLLESPNIHSLLYRVNTYSVRQSLINYSTVHSSPK